MKKQKRFGLILSAVLLLALGAETALARPEYAVRYNLNRCTACHYSPAGGGARNLNGKLFGAFGYRMTSLAKQDYAGLDAKLQYYRPPQKSEQVRGGMGVMLGNVWVSAPIQDLSSDSAEIRLVAEQNLGGFVAGPRQWYARLAVSSDTQTSWLPQYVLGGRLIPAFGLLTDEHRTYVRLQSGTTWSQGFDTGFMASANPFDSVHYDIALVNGQKNPGTALDTDMANVWGSVLNLRVMPARIPVALGLSGQFYSAGANAKGSEASSAYALLSFHRLTGNRVPVTVSAEFVQARNWNSTIVNFVSNANYLTSVSDATSHGYYGLVDWQITERFSAQYKYDKLILDRDFPADDYQRHGFGFKSYLAANFWVLFRYEKAATGVPAEKDGTKTGALDAVWALFNVSI